MFTVRTLVLLNKKIRREGCMKQYRTIATSIKTFCILTILCRFVTSFRACYAIWLLHQKNIFDERNCVAKSQSCKGQTMTSFWINSVERSTISVPGLHGKFGWFSLDQETQTEETLMLSPLCYSYNQNMCIKYTYSHREGGELMREKVRGAIVQKASW